MQNKPINSVWVVDDDPLQVLALNRLLSAHPAVRSTRFFSGGKAAMEAMAVMKGQPGVGPDIIFLDLIMSKGDGWEFLEYFKKYKAKIGLTSRIVVISSFNEDSANRLKQYNDVIEFLPKPIEKKPFEDVIALVTSTMPGSSVKAAS